MVAFAETKLTHLSANAQKDIAVPNANSELAPARQRHVSMVEYARNNMEAASVINVPAELVISAFIVSANLKISAVQIRATTTAFAKQTETEVSNATVARDLLAIDATH